MIDLGSGQFLTNGLILLGAGGAMAGLREVPHQLMDLVRRKVVTTIDITNQDPSYRWLQSWMDKHPFKAYSRSVSVVGKEKGTDTPDILLTPAPGLHFFTYKGKFFWITRNREKAQADGYYNGGGSAWIETVSISTLGGDRDMVMAMVRDMYDSYKEDEKDHIDIHTYMHTWDVCSSRPYRAPDSVILRDGVMESLLSDLDTFRANRERYVALGVPWKRGYLFYGQPGSGKSSTVLAMASHLKCDVYIVNLASPDVTDASLMEMLSSTKSNSIVLLEEIDTIFHDRTGKTQSHASFGGLLNSLDGLTAQEGRVVVMTTNHPEVLDPALIRPGRVDIRIEMGAADSSQVLRMFQRFYPEAPEHLAKTVAGAVKPNHMSMARVQEMALSNMDDPLGFVAAMVSYCNSPKEELTVQ